MCGLVGIFQYESEVPRSVRNRALKILFSELMLKTEVRGKDATGLYQVMADGDWMMTKKGQRVTDWVFMDRSDKKCEDPIIYEDVIESWSEHPQELKGVVGHCRAKTVGNTDNENNHPFAIQLDESNALLGVHNGTIYNHEVIFDRLPKIIERQGTVDSEAIFHLLYHLTEHGTKPMTGEIIKELGKRVDGAYACIVMNSRFPNQMSVFREGRPIELFLISPLNILVISSQKGFMDSALEKYEFIRRFIDRDLPELDSQNKMLPERDYRIFDLSMEFPSEPLSYIDFTKLEEEKGEIKRYIDDVEEQWKDPKNVRPKTSAGGTSYNTGAGRVISGGGRSSTPAAGSQAKVTKATAAAASAAPKPEDKGVTVNAEVVEVEIGSEADAQQIYEKVKVLGLAPDYSTSPEVAKALGVTDLQLRNMNTVELVNAVAKTHFNLGCAASRLESQGQYLGVREKAKEILRKLDKAEGKQLKAQNHIWAIKTTIQILVALHESRSALSTDNVEKVLRAFPKLGEQRRAEVLKAAESILDADDTRSAVETISDWVAKSRKPKKEEKTISS